ncbi:MAG TPA: glycine zipper family protein [Polyangiaceae bacterium]|nr:glycine zipper family protein [Polyangiaceae bacterium]
MAEVLRLSLSFPAVFYTALLGVVLVYWLFVIIGAVDLSQTADGLGTDAGMDGFDADAVVGATKGAVEGAAKGVLEATVSLEGTGGEAGGDGDAGEMTDADTDGPIAAVVSALGLRSVPATVVFSLLITLAWLLTVVSMQLTARHAPEAPHWTAWLALTVAPVLALLPTALLVRPLAPLFAHRKAPSRSDLLGKTCIVRTGTVTPSFGEAMLEDGGAGLIVRVRVDGPRPLKRGDHALLIDWDPAREAFVVEPLEELLGSEQPH